MAAVSFKKMLIMMHCIFIWGSLRSTFSKYSFVGGVTKMNNRSVLILLKILDDN